MSSKYSEELELALRAVHRASIVTKNVMKGIESVEKSDESPVTVADFAAQALIISAIHSRFPQDRFVAEESADMLRKNPTLSSKVWRLLTEQTTSDSSSHTDSDVSSSLDRPLSVPRSEQEMWDTIDLGSKGDPPTSGRVWILDPVDGTATFLKGQQYVVCLSLTLDGKQQIGVLGCPNLKPGEGRRVEEDLTDRDGYGVVLAAVLGEGAFMAATSRDGLGTRHPVKRAMQSENIADLQFTDSVRSSHAHLPSHQKVRQRLGVTKDYLNYWSMQIKYVALALGACDAMIRIPPRRDIRACVWDHAGGQLIFTESGGKITDLEGNDFDFAKGREFGQNWGWVAADAKVYDAVNVAAQEVLKERESS